MESILEVAKLDIIKRNSYLFIQQIPFAFLLDFQMVKNWPAMQETWVQSLCWEDPMEDKWQPTPVFLPREFQGQRSLVGYSPWGCKELDMTERLHLIFSKKKSHRSIFFLNIASKPLNRILATEYPMKYKSSNTELSFPKNVRLVWYQKANWYNSTTWIK